MSNLHINLSQFKSAKATIFVGKLQGEYAREVLKLDIIDNHLKKDKGFEVTFEFPEDTLSVNDSFLKGLLDDTFKKVGYDTFYARVKITCLGEHYDIRNDVNRFMSTMRAIHEK